ncbi:hypothetical protein PAESOLCIP111_06535 [Paenibacillus solanacearum]|uniref:YolD-like family protein n=1 Tax=Paenibacillus solanacearum TaxID=2048548 RepID=A0A916NYY6_9BACL|nr:YolD-like family protein [Paenibacillus solanacearum]CAG7652434.1 hypothetical protein PAESOLCIP111_06535 [Paenibacillus solanacearum]
MSEKLKPNGIWMTKMMLPEHKERINRHNEQLEVQTRPVLDEQKQEEISRMLLKAYEDGNDVTVTLFQSKSRMILTGRIAKRDHLLQRLLIGGQWVSMADIVDCE